MQWTMAFQCRDDNKLIDEERACRSLGIPEAEKYPEASEPVVGEVAVRTWRTELSAASRS